MKRYTYKERLKYCLWEKPYSNTRIVAIVGVIGYVVFKIQHIKVDLINFIWVCLGVLFLTTLFDYIFPFEFFKKQDKSLK